MSIVNSNLGRGSRVVIFPAVRLSGRGTGTITAIIGVGEYCHVAWDDKSTSVEWINQLRSTE